MRRLLTLAMLFVMLTQCNAQDSKSSLALTSGKSSFNMPFELVDNRIFIDVQLNGKGPFKFILDTGDMPRCLWRRPAPPCFVSTSRNKEQVWDRPALQHGEQPLPRCESATSDSLTRKPERFHMRTLGMYSVRGDSMV
jgi:hypothetical protein